MLSHILQFVMINCINVSVVINCINVSMMELLLLMYLSRSCNRADFSFHEYCASLDFFVAIGKAWRDYKRGCLILLKVNYKKRE